jgi:hypothetical protein
VKNKSIHLFALLNKAKKRGVSIVHPTQTNLIKKDLKKKIKKIQPQARNAAKFQTKKRTPPTKKSSM